MSETIRVIAPYGIIYVLNYLGALWHKASLLTQAEEIAALLPELIEQDDKIDLLAGQPAAPRLC